MSSKMKDQGKPGESSTGKNQPVLEKRPEKRKREGNDAPDRNQAEKKSKKELRKELKKGEIIPQFPGQSQAGTNANGDARKTDPNSSTITADSIAPRGINVAEFAEARALELASMLKALGKASKAKSKRAFQSLPRHMRRRAASHNIRRVPRRLRQKAKYEVISPGIRDPAIRGQ